MRPLAMTQLATGFVVVDYAAVNPRSYAMKNGRPSATMLTMVSSYGPHPINTTASDDDETAAAKRRFRSFLEECVAVSSKNPDHLPKLMADNVESIMSLHGIDGTEVIGRLLEEAASSPGGGSETGEQFQRLSHVVDVVLTFAEQLAEISTDFDKHNKHLLGKIIRMMTSKDQSLTPLQKEERLDNWLAEEKHNFTPGFLRHLEGECSRIANAPKMTAESTRLLEIIRIIQARVLEELGKDIGGEAAVVLGQLMGYDSDVELLGVLDAGLTVRGISFASQMSDLTAEALGGFQKVPGGADPELVRKVNMINSRLNEFLEESDRFQ